MDTQRARHLRKNMTQAERKLWLILRLRQMGRHKFRRQHPVGRYIADFVCLEKHLIVELDGGQHLIQSDYDVKRTMWLDGEGYRVLRFWDHEVFKETEAVKQAIWDALRASANPPPLRAYGSIEPEAAGPGATRPIGPEGSGWGSNGTP